MKTILALGGWGSDEEGKQISFCECVLKRERDQKFMWAGEWGSILNCILFV